VRRVYVLVEGKNDEAMLRRVLSEELLEDVQLVNAGGSDSIPSLARSMLVRRRRPIAVLIDAHSLDPDVIDERQQGTEELIRAANSSIPVKVVTAIPEIEAWLLTTPETVARLVGQSVSQEWLDLGKRDPKHALTSMAAKANRKWDTDEAIKSLDERDIQLIRTIPEVVALSEFLQNAKKNGTG
jgi:hypothetical protein